MSYSLQTSVITAFWKHFPWSELILRGTPYLKNHSLRSTLAVVLTRWSLVETACVNLVKTSVITNTFSLPSVAGSKSVKWIARTSKGLVGRRCPIAGLTRGSGSLDKAHLSDFFIHASTSLCIPGQEQRSLIRCNILSLPWWPIPSCKLASTFSLSLWGRINFFRWPNWGSWMTRYNCWTSLYSKRYQNYKITSKTTLALWYYLLYLLQLTTLVVTFSLNFN